MKRVLMVSCEGLGNGGVQAVMMNIIRNMHKEYLFDMLLFTSEKRHYDDEFLTYGGKIYRIPRYEGNNKLRKKIDYYIRGSNLYRGVRKLIKEEGPFDIVHCNAEFESAPIMKAASEFGIPIRITHTHIISKKNNCIATYLENHRKKVIDKYATKKIGCSLEACSSFFLDGTKATVINNTYDESRFNPKLYSYFEEDRLHIIQVGSFCTTKNQLFSVEVLYQIQKQIKNVHLSFVGFDMEGYEKLVKDKIKHLNLEKYVSFYPSDTNIPQLLAKSNAFIFPSLHEGFGIAIIEAQAMGVRCFASDGVPKVTNCGGVTFINLADGAKVWADKIIKAYRKYGNCKKGYDVSGYTMMNVISIYRELYEGK
ncbi:MAG: glycosyltransferase [Lachnospiraceae bacterium]|nr:MAG: glycosyltransferase [Lachnospiraceae bacterium]